MSGDSRDETVKTAQNFTPNARMIFTGPDYLRDHQVTVEPEHRAVGIGTMSGEGTSETDYLWRPAPGTPFHGPKTSKVGEIGWGIKHFTDWTVPATGRQVMMGEFRQDLENRHSHKYQNPWYPGENDTIDPDEARLMSVQKSRSSESNQRHRSGTASRSLRHTGRTPAATPLYTTNILTLITSSDEQGGATGKASNAKESHSVKAH